MKTLDIPIFTLYFALLVFYFSAIDCKSQIDQKRNTDLFPQEVKRDIRIPKEVMGDFIRLCNWNEDILLVTTNGFYLFDEQKWEEDPGQEYVTTSIDHRNRLWLVSSDKVISYPDGKSVLFPPDFDGKNITDIFWEDDHTLLVGTTGGILRYNEVWSVLEEFSDIHVNQIVAGKDSDLWVTTLNGLWQRSDNRWLRLDDYLMAEGTEQKYYGLESRNQGKEIIFSSPYSVGCIAANGEHWSYSGSEGLPFGPVKVIRSTGCDYWFGTDKGVIKKDSTWHYYYGKRWLHEDEVIDLLIIDKNTVWVCTPHAISEIKEVEMTLAQKGEIYEEVIEKRHNRLGLINRSTLEIPGDLSSSKIKNQDNDGLWTSTYLIAQCFKYGATGKEDARLKAIRTFEALERLETVTGISGYPARSYARAVDHVEQSRSPHPKHWHLSPDGRWQWLDDTSSDEIVGHLFSISLFIELVAEGELKDRAIQLIDRIVSHIIDHDFQMMDYDGEPTRWGIWNPDSLNNSPRWAYERGLNSLQILSHLKTAYHFTGNSKYEENYRYLVSEHGYIKNAIQAKKYGPFEVSHSDDILNFFPYYGLIKYAKEDSCYSDFVKSLERTWAAVRSDRMPVWNILSSILLEKDCDINIARSQLEKYPVDLIDWSVTNSHRWDLQHSTMTDRFDKPQSTRPIPPPESQIFRWNTNPFQLDSGSDGAMEVPGTYFLCAYWMGRYYELIN